MEELSTKEFNEIYKMNFSFKFIKVLNGNTKNKENTR